MMARAPRLLRRGSAVLLGLGAAFVLVCSAVAASFASRPRLMRLLGWVPGAARDPSDVGLEFEDVEYLPGVKGWFVSVADPVAAAVIVHGLETSSDPRATDQGPRLELAAALCARGYSVLVINLGYANGRRPYSAGRFESDDVCAASSWIAERVARSVAIIGMSAGGHAAVAAGRQAPDVFAVVTDSAFVDGGAVVIEQASTLTPVPKLAFVLVPAIMRLLNKTSPVDLAATKSSSPAMFHIHGSSDTAVGVDNVRRLAAATGGETWVVADAEHVRAYTTDPAGYVMRVTTFLDRALATRR